MYRAIRNAFAAAALCQALACLLLLPAAAQAGAPLSCAYADRVSGQGIEQHPACAQLVGGKLLVDHSQLARMAFDQHGLAAVWVEKQWYYLKRSGVALPVLADDNGADDYAQGLVRSQVDGRVAYYDRQFRQVIAPRYDWGWPFEHGRALVCSGCKPGTPDADGHTAVLGGSWGYIDRRGRELVPVKLSRDEALRQFSGP